MIKSFLISQINFLPVLTIPTGSKASMVSIKDMNNDGKEDVILGTAYYFDTLNDYKVFIFLQNEEGQLEDPVKYSYPASYPGLTTLAVDDVNNDHLNDVIIGYGKTMGIYFQNDTGTLNPMQPFILDPTIHSLSTGDLNHDGLSDIAVAVQYSSQPYIRVYYQTLTGFNKKDFSKPNTQSDEIEIGDVNHDGLEDVVLLDGSSDGGIYVYLQNTNGLLDNFHFYSPGPLEHHSLNGIGIGDLNNDNALDIAASKGGNRPVSKLLVWFQNAALDTLTPPVDYPAYDVPYPVEIQDLNCDGKNEIITGHSGWDAITIFQQDSAGQYSSYIVFGAPTNGIRAQGLSIGDINDDGRPDIAFSDFTKGLSILLNHSIPSNFDSIDTIVVSQNISRDTFLDQDYLVVQTVDTSMNYQITQLDSFRLDKFLQIDSFTIDSFFIRNATFCSRPYTDTLIQVASLSDSVLISSDTFFISMHVDTTLILRDVGIDFYPGFLKIYPNPSDKYIILQMEHPVPFSSGTVQLFDNMGTLFYRDFFIDPIMKIDIRSLHDGLFYVLLMTDDTFIVRKCIKAFTSEK